MDRAEAERIMPLLAFRPYGWQVEFIAASKTHKQKMLCAANRVGKSRVAAYEVAIHLLGAYPKDWPGIQFDFPPLVWALGVSGEQIRDVIQAQLFGIYDGRRFTGGLVPAFSILEVLPAQGTPRLAKDVRVRHKHGTSTLSLKSYSQGQHPLMGSEIDYAWVDEEPQDPSIYPQVVTRTATGNQGQGGYLSITETPELGMTELLINYMEHRGASQHFQNVTWEDALHLTPDVRRELLDALPEYQREMRSKGIPLLGEGRIFDVAEERLLVDPFPIPDHWFRIAAIDFGIDHPTACVWLAEDRDADIIYVVDEYAQSGETPPVHAAAIKARPECPVIYPHDGDNTEKGSGETLASVYNDCGLPLHLKFSNSDGSNYVEPGLMELNRRMREGRLKVFRTCQTWLKEYRRYHRKNGKIVKVDDDLMDATRYAAISAGRFAKQGGDHKPRSINVPRHQRINRTGRSNVRAH